MTLYVQSIQEQFISIQSDVVTFQQSLFKIPNTTFNSTPRTKIFENHHAKLYHYHKFCAPNASADNQKPPIFILYSFINKPTILDIDKEHSFIYALIQEGYDVYLVEWIEPEKQQTMLGFADYITIIIKQCVQAALAHVKQEKINLIGICQGGVFSLCFAALFPRYIRRLITLVTPINFNARNYHWIKKIKAIIPDLPDSRDINIIPGEWINPLFSQLNPMKNLYQKYFDLVDTKIEQQKLALFLKVETWLHDCPNQPYPLSRDFFEMFVLRNQLMKHDLKLNERQVSLKDLDIPTYAIYAKDDQLVTRASAHALRKIIYKDCYKETVLKGGHISFFVNKKTQKILIKNISKFFMMDPHLHT